MQMLGLPEKSCGGTDCEVNQTMIYIKKKKPPSETIREVSRIKSNPDWKKIQSGNTKAIRNKFDELSKEPIRQSLLEEQSGLCAYCMRRIENNGRTTRIEHWYPLSKDKDQALDYRNMLAVCDGGANYQGNEKKILCCDAFKGDDEELMISPLNVQHMQKITYDKKGYIKTQIAQSDEDFKLINSIAGDVMHEAFDKITAEGQIDYMINLYLTPEAMKRNTSEKEYTYKLIYFNGEAAGFFAYCPAKRFQPSFEEGTFLSKLYIKKFARGKKVTSNLLASLNRPVYLTVKRDDVHSVNIFKHYGFKIAQSVTADIGGGFVMDDFLMVHGK